MTKTFTELTANEYFEWSRKSTWSNTEAAYLLAGKRPPSNKLDSSAIECLFPYLKAVFGQARHYPAREAKFPQNLIHLALDLDLKSDALTNWEAIFPFGRTQSMTSILERKPDYREFSYAYLRNIEMDLGELARFALNLSWEDVQQEVDNSGSRFEIKEYHYVLRAMATQFDREGLPRKELEAVPVNARSFVRHYPRIHFAIDDRCDQWIGWVEANAELASLIQMPASDTDETSIGAKSVSSIRKAEGMRAALTILRGLYSAGHSVERKALRTILAKSKVADEVLTDPRRYPVCCAYMKQQVSRNKDGNFATRFPSLARDWPAFAVDRAVLSELERLELEK